MILKTKVKFIDERLKIAFENLKDGRNDERELYSLLCSAFEDIETNAFCGVQIPKKQIPTSYIKNYGVKNLWKYNLSKSWRLIYSIENKEICVISIVLDWLDHKNYENKFNY